MIATVDESCYILFVRRKMKIEKNRKIQILKIDITLASFVYMYGYPDNCIHYLLRNLLSTNHKHVYDMYISN